MTVATGLPWWDDGDGAAWDRLYMAGSTWPGVWSVAKAAVSRKLDVKRTKGSDQATISDEGYQPAKLSLTGTLWERAQWVEWQRLLPLIHPRAKGGARAPVQLIHPQANVIGIETVYVESIATAFDKATQILTITIDALEWVPAPKPVKKAAGKGSTIKPKTEDDKAATPAEATPAEVAAGEGLAKNPSSHKITNSDLDV